MFNMLDDHHQVKTKGKRREGEGGGAKEESPKCPLSAGLWDAR